MLQIGIFLCVRNVNVLDYNNYGYIRNEQNEIKCYFRNNVHKNYRTFYCRAMQGIPCIQVSNHAANFGSQIRYPYRNGLYLI